MVQKGLTHKIKVKQKKETPIKQQDEEYGIVHKCLGGNRFEVLLVRLGKIYNVPSRGALSNVKISMNDVVLCQKDSSSSEIKYLLIWKYSADEAHELKRQGELRVIKKERISDTIAFEADIINAKNNEIEIDDNFIEDL